MNVRVWVILILMSVYTWTSGFSQQRVTPISGNVKVIGGSIHYEEIGAGPAVILIHGGQLDHRMWDGLVSVLKGSYRLNGLILAGPGLRGFKSNDDDSMNVKEWETIEAARDSGYVYATELWLKNPYMSPAMEQPALRDRIRALALDNARNWLVNPLVERPLKPRAIDRLRDVSVPTLIIIGDRDILRMQGIADTLARAIPHADKAVIHGAGHIVNMERPVEFNRIVSDFLARIRQRGGP